MTAAGGDFWSGRRVFLTGHPGFKGAWLGLRQHVVDARHGYMMLAEALAGRNGPPCATGWNSDSDAADEISVAEFAGRAAALWGKATRIETSAANSHMETRTLRLNSMRARSLLGWQPRWKPDQALQRAADRYRAWSLGHELRDASLAQLDDYLAAAT